MQCTPWAANGPNHLVFCTPCSAAQEKFEKLEVSSFMDTPQDKDFARGQVGWSCPNTLSAPSSPLISSLPCCGGRLTRARPFAQVDFINFVVIPLWSTLVDVFPQLQPRLTQLLKNREFWLQVPLMTMHFNHR